MKVMVDTLASAQGGAPIRLNLHRVRAASQMAAECWASRVMWLMVFLTSVWDIAVTFGRFAPGSR